MVILLTFVLLSANAAESDSDAKTTEDLAKESPNPIANLISVPFQNNFNFGIGPNDTTHWDLNVQPVIPITLNKDWNLITRTIVPIMNQPSPAPGKRRIRPRRHQPHRFPLAGAPANYVGGPTQ